MNAFGWFVTAIGAFVAFTALFKPGWLTEYSASFLDDILPERVARWVYFVIGLALATLGVLAALGVISNPF